GSRERWRADRLSRPLHQGTGGRSRGRRRRAVLLPLGAAPQFRGGVRLRPPLRHRLPRLSDPQTWSQGILRLAGAADPGAEEMIEGWVTRSATALLQPMQPVAFASPSPEDGLAAIEVDDGRTFQPIEGFGFALTGGSAYLLGGLDKV